MAEMISWSGRGGIAFYATATEIRGFKDFSIKTSVETEDKTQNGEKFVKKKNNGAYEIELTAILNAMLGVDVKALAMKMAEAARCGDSGYFYTAGAKLFPSSFMCVSADIGEIDLLPNGTWKSCKVDWKLKQCSKYGGGSGSSSSGTKKTASSKKKSTKSGSTKSKKTQVKEVTSQMTAIKFIAQTVNNLRKKKYPRPTNAGAGSPKMSMK